LKAGVVGLRIWRSLQIPPNKSCEQHHEALPCTSRPFPYVHYRFRSGWLGCSGKAMNGFPELLRLWAAKHMSHFCGTGWMQLICGFWDHSRCPRCQQDNETTTHILFAMVMGQIKNG
jgi:hypothetical protein